MPHLLRAWPQASIPLNDAKQVLLGLDFDGTLSPIVDRPDLAVLPDPAKQSLIKLGRRQKFLVAIVSTRSLADVRDKVGIDGLVYTGNRGLEINGGGMEFVHPEALRLRERVDQAARRLEQAVERFDGVMVEHKELSLAVHYRLAPDESVSEVKQTVDAEIEPFLASGYLRMSTGKMVVEVLPNLAWGKGDALREIWAALNQDSFPVYFGDDLVDEEGFASVQDAGGFGVFVGPAGSATAAHYRLDSPQEVAQVLELMARI